MRIKWRKVEKKAGTSVSAFLFGRDNSLALDIFLFFLCPKLLYSVQTLGDVLDMTLKEAAQTALDIQNACNASGIIKTLAGPVLDALNAERQQPGGYRVNTSPVIAMFLYKLGELNGCGICSMSEGYAEAEAACKALAACDCATVTINSETVHELTCGLFADMPLGRVAQ